MSFPLVPEPLRELVARLPFGLDETERAGAAFRRWRHAADGEGAREKYIVDLWTYCFVRRYFWAKFAANPSYPASDLDELVERVYRKVEAKRATVREPARYAHWVSVICKNTFLNYVDRARAPDVSLNDDETPVPPSGAQVRGELGMAHEVVAEAVEALPDYLRPVARMRLLEERSYQAISQKTGTAVPTARSYAARARKWLREDDAVRALWEQSHG
ncbi:MAG: sigma-70 family RNA polymerase sigma factor [Bacteroidetes bacterium QS_9_68_14]|nr:MAG: sigma-70 family RNA polymerase sigma factor [Bacteroidetes bacterium QS_9_68_14]